MTITVIHMTITQSNLSMNILTRFGLHAAWFGHQLMTLMVDLHVAHHAGTALVAAPPHEFVAVPTPGGHQEGAASEVVHTCVNKGAYSSPCNESQCCFNKVYTLF